MTPSPDTPWGEEAYAPLQFHPEAYEAWQLLSHMELIGPLKVGMQFSYLENEKYSRFILY